MLSLSIEIFILRIFIISHYVYKEPLMKNVLCFLSEKQNPSYPKTLRFSDKNYVRKQMFLVLFREKNQRSWTCSFHSHFLSFFLREICQQWNQWGASPYVKIHKKKCCFYNKKGKSSSFLEGKMEVGISMAFLTHKGR